MFIIFNLIEKLISIIFRGDIKVSRLKGPVCVREREREGGREREISYLLIFLFLRKRYKPKGR